MKTVKCKYCGKEPHKLFEYVSAARAEKMNPRDYVIENEGTYNGKTGLFYCTGCYIKIGSPLGKA